MTSPPPLTALPISIGGSVHMESIVQAEMFHACNARGLRHAILSSWPASASELDIADPPAGAAIDVTQRTADGIELILSAPHALAYINIHRGVALVRAVGVSPKAADDLLAVARRVVPRTERAAGEIPVAFWSYSAHGPRQLKRPLEAPSWEDIAVNYTFETRAALADLVAPTFKPAAGGQLLLWTGEPGTGKTTALRALAREWVDWCEVHYITDPERFFGTNADYMIDVMVQESSRELLPMGALGHETERREMWRLLVAEDTGELLRRDAKAEQGQALSRLLNVVDGMIGQGLRILVLVTTNEEISTLNEAVTRPGRCAANIAFETLDPAEQAAWFEENGASYAELQGVELGDDEGLEITGRRTIADLYAMLAGRPTADRPLVGFARA